MTQESTPRQAVARDDEAVAKADTGARHEAAPGARADAGPRSDGHFPGAARPPGALEETIRIARRRKWVLLITILFVGGVALGLSLLGKDKYEAKAAILFRESATASLLNPGTGVVSDPERAAATRKQLLELDFVARQTAKAMGGGLTTDDVADKIRIDAQEQADVVDVYATDESGRLAARIANTYARSFIVSRQRVERAQLVAGIARLRRALKRLPRSRRFGATGDEFRNRIRKLRGARPLQTGNAELVQRADVPIAPVPRHIERNVLFGLLLGAVLGFALAWLLERLDRRVKTVEELEEVYGLPVLARIPRSRALRTHEKRRATEGALTRESVFSEEAEAFRTLRANLRHFNTDRDIRSILVASAMSGEGKSTVARFLAITIATTGTRVVLVDGDMRKLGRHAPSVDVATEGLSLVLGGLDLDDALMEVLVASDPGANGSRSLFELSSGPLPPNPSELLEGDRMRLLLDELESRFDVVIIDSPALASVSDALVLVPRVSGVLIVSGMNDTARNSALALRKQLTLGGGRPLGIVANFWNREGEPYGRAGVNNG
jgi:capsular exopolysaccharide synthesis family protein